jgi:uncharacterized protein YjbJ (UPF0337 family)
MSDKADELAGKAKEKAGEMMDKPDLEEEGRREQVEADVKQGAEKLKDAAEKI